MLSEFTRMADTFQQQEQISKAIAMAQRGSKRAEIVEVQDYLLSRQIQLSNFTGRIRNNFVLHFKFLFAATQRVKQIIGHGLYFSCFQINQNF